MNFLENYSTYRHASFPWEQISWNYPQETFLSFTRNAGRLVFRRKGFAFTHTGIHVGEDQFGREMVIHNHPYNGKADVVTMVEFANGEQVHFDNAPCAFSQKEVWERAIDTVQTGGSYHLLFNNCQHTTSMVCHGRKQSSDIDLLKGLLILGIGIAAVTAIANSKS